MKKSPENVYELTFDSSNSKPKVRMGYLIIPVKPTATKPVQCFSCYKFGHTKQYCKNLENPICEFRKELKHDGLCSKPPSCINYKMTHPS